MKNLIIGFTSKQNNFLHNITQGIEQNMRTDDTLHSMIIDANSTQPIQTALDAQEFSAYYDNIILVIENDMQDTQLTQLSVLTTYLSKPFSVIFEHLKKSSNPIQKETIANLCKKATVVFSLQNNITDLLTHHYQTESEKIVSLNYGFWPTPEADNSKTALDRMAIICDESTLESLENIIKCLPKLKKGSNKIVADIFLPEELTNDSHWIIRNRILINRLNLNDSVSWNRLTEDSMSSLTSNYGLFFFCWNSTHGGNRTMRYEAMASGGITIGINDLFAEEKFNDGRSIILNRENTFNLAENLSTWLQDSMFMRGIRETAQMAEAANTWVDAGRKIKRNIEVAASSCAQYTYPAYDILTTPLFSNIHRERVSTILAASQNNLTGHELMLLNNAARVNDGVSIPEIAGLLHNLKINIDSLNVFHGSHFLTAHLLLQLSKLNIGGITSLASAVFEQMAPAVKEDYHLIEIHYHLIKFIEKNTPILDFKIKERAAFLMNQIESEQNENIGNTDENTLKTLVTLLEVAEITRNRTIAEKAASILASLDNNNFSHSAYRPSNAISTDRIMWFSYLLSYCHNQLFASERKEYNITRIDQIWGWIFGFNDKNRIFFNSEFGRCSTNSDASECFSFSSVNDTLLFWLIQHNVQKSYISTYCCNIEKAPQEKTTFGFSKAQSIKY